MRRTTASALTKTCWLLLAYTALSQESRADWAEGDKLQRPTLPIPTRELEWGDVNFISTSDTHGWLLGHQHATWPEPNYSGDFGDLASFVTHMRDIASSKGSDLLLMNASSSLSQLVCQTLADPSRDCGDHHDGSGLVSSSKAGADRADDIFNQLQYDVITIGNHELYSYTVARTIYEQAKGMGGRYLTSNVNITIPTVDGTAISVPIGAQYRKFETKQGRRVTAFGVIFDFQAHDFNLTIQSPTSLSKESWFLETIQDAPDYFVLAGHMPVRGEGADWTPVYDVIRAQHPDVPIFIFGGHTHVRDCTQYDDRSIAVVPGRYLETATFVSSDLPKRHDGKESLRMNRRYIDSNRVSYQFHSKTNDTSFDAPLGRNITANLHTLASSLNISTPLGKAPHDLYLAKYPYGHKRSALTEWNEHVLPLTVIDERRKGKRIIIGNTGTLRFDLFAGRFDRNDELTISPFKNAFSYTRLPADFALRIAPQMNRAGASKFAPSISSLRNQLSPSDVERMRYEDDLAVRRGYELWLADQRDEYELSETRTRGQEDQVVFGVSDGTVAGGKKGLTLGYVTKDACSGKGDDIEHIPLPRSLSQPDFSQTTLDISGLSKPDEMIDVVLMDFSMDDFLIAVHTLHPELGMTKKDLKPYAEGTRVDTLWGAYAGLRW